MGNCQAAQAEATAVLYHHGGEVERLRWPTSAAEVMRSHPGHYVALVTLRIAEEGGGGGGGGRRVRLMRVKLLRPRDTLLLGQAYRLVAAQEVKRALQARRDQKMKQRQMQIGVDSESDEASKEEKDWQSGSCTQSSARARHWRPSLQNIAEVGG